MEELTWTHFLRFLNVEKTYKLEVGKFMYKEKRNLLPVQIAQYFNIRTYECTRYPLRNRETRNVEINQRTNVGDKSIQKRGRIFWENIPDEIKNLETHLSFKIYML